MLDCLRDIRYETKRCSSHTDTHPYKGGGGGVLYLQFVDTSGGSGGGSLFKRSWRPKEAHINQRIRSRNRFTRHSFATEEATSVS